MERYTYHIHPHRTITNVIPGKGIRRPMGLKLTKEEVLKCLACGPVYRVFPGIPPVRVTGSNLDELHVSKDEYLKKDVEKEEQANRTENLVEESNQEPVDSQPTENGGLTEEKPSEKPVVGEKTIITDPNMPNAIIDIDVTTVAVVEEAPAPVEETPVEHTEEELAEKMTDMESKEVVFEGPNSSITLITTTEGEPVNVEASDVSDVTEGSTLTVSEGEPATIEAPDNTIEESDVVGVYESEEESDEEDEEEEENTEETVVAPANGPTISQQPHYKKKKKRY